MAVEINSTEALDLWRRTIVEFVRRDGPDLTARQTAVLLTVYLTWPPHTVRGLATELGVSKPAITRALDRLSDLRLIRRKQDENDKRSILVQRTVQGSVFLSDLGQVIRRAGEDASGDVSRM